MNMRTRAMVTLRERPCTADVGPVPFPTGVHGPTAAAQGRGSPARCALEVPAVSTSHSLSPRIQMMALLGNLALVGAWALVMFRPGPWWLPVGAGLVVAFLALRVAPLWAQARALGTPAARRIAVIYTVVGVAVGALWAYSAVQPPRGL